MAQSRAWKALERRVASMWGAKRRGPAGEAVSDCVALPDGPELFFSIDTTRSKGRRIRRSKVEQVFRNAASEGRPPLLVVADHGDRPSEWVVVTTHDAVLELARRAGVAPLERKAA